MDREERLPSLEMVAPGVIRTTSGTIPQYFNSLIVLMSSIIQSSSPQHNFEPEDEGPGTGVGRCGPRSWGL
jgi:hypothetical protein